MAYRDSCQAWFVAAASSLMFVLSTGNARSNGVFFIPLIEAENLTRSDASWPFNLAGVTSIVAEEIFGQPHYKSVPDLRHGEVWKTFIFVYLLQTSEKLCLPPLTGFLVSHYSPATTCILGSFLFVVGQMAGFFTTNIYVFSCFYGIIRGIGMTILPTVGVMITSSSFVRHRSSAMGLCLAGGSIGGMIIPVVAQYLLLIYGLQGTFLLMAGISMQSFVFSLAFMWYRDDGPTHTTPSNSEDQMEENERTLLLSSPPDIKIRRHQNGDSESHEIWKETATSLLTRAEEQVMCSKSRSDGSTVASIRRNVEQQADIYKKSVEKSLAEDFRMVKSICVNPGFIFMTVIQVFVITIMALFTQVFLDYLKEKDISEVTSVYGLSFISGGEILGKLCPGMILDMKIISFSTFAAVSLVLGGLVPYIFTLSVSVPLLFFTAFVYGAASGAALTSNVVHVNDYVPRERIHMAQALTKGFQGLGFFTIAPTIGLFRDQLGNYDYLFYYMTAVHFILALVSVLEGIYFNLKMPEFSSSEGSV